MKSRQTLVLTYTEELRVHTNAVHNLLAFLPSKSRDSEEHLSKRRTTDLQPYPTRHRCSGRRGVGCSSHCWWARLTARLTVVVGAARVAALGEGSVGGQEDNGCTVVLRAGVGWVCLGVQGRGREVVLGLLRRVGQCRRRGAVSPLLRPLVSTSQFYYSV